MFTGHDRSNDPLLGPSPGGNFNEHGGEERNVWGGRSARMKVNPDGTQQWSPSAREQDVNRYRDMGAGMANRPSVQLQYGDANRSLGQANQAMGQAYTDRSNAAGARAGQNAAMGLQQQAAMGAAPSRAEILGRGLIDQSLKSQVAAGASARGGPLAQMAARRQAAGGAAAFRQQGMNQLSALRADEMERGRAGFSAAANSMRQQDYAGADNAARLGLAYGDTARTQAGMAEGQGRMDLGQRELNQRGQLDYEQLGWNTNNAAGNMGLGAAGQEMQGYQFGQEMGQRDADRTERYVGAATGAGGALIGAGITSDMRAKTPAPLLLSTGKQPKAANPNWLDGLMSPERTQMKGRQQQEEHEDRLEQHAPEVDGSQIQRDDPYAPPTPGGIQREDPYGSGEVFYSDENAKKAAFNQGLTYGQGELYWGSKGQPNQEPLPDYMQGKQRTPAKSGEGRELSVQGPATATGIDPKARGERPPPPANIGDRATEQGHPRPQMTGIPPRKDVTGQKPGPLASIQQDANRRGAGFPYAYKPEFNPPDQSPGELNYGFSAQELEKNPITATAVKQDPNGMRFIDTDKLLKTNTAGIASLQAQLDQLQYGGRRG
jgi:hypothetical protein